VLRLLLLAGLVAVLGWFLWVYGQIHFYATHDQARPADAIAVFGAAEYDGRPSPVLRARLDHALSLYREHLAPLVVTLGGGGGPRDSEGGVGHDYLLAHGVPENQIIAETQSTNTEESAARPCGFRRDASVSHSRSLREHGAHGVHFAAGGGSSSRTLGCVHAADARDDQLHALAVEGALTASHKPSS
jgi:hypothetical protein